MLGFTAPPRTMSVGNSMSAPPVILIPPVPGGSFLAGQVLTCPTGIWANSPVQFEYRWQTNGVDNGDTDNQYTVLSGDDGYLLTCLVRARNDAGWSGWVASVAVIGLASALWLDAADMGTLTQSGGFVSQWNDKSGHGRHVIQPASVNQPSTGVATINGKNALRFDGTTDFLYLTAPFVYAAGAATVFAVHKANSSNGMGLVAEGNTGSAIPVASIVGSGTVAGKFDDVRTFFRNDANTVVHQVEHNASVFNGDPAISVIRDTGSDVRVYANGLADNSKPYTRSGTLTLNSFSVGAVRRNTVSGYFNGDVAEIIIYTRALTDEEINRVGRYLAEKWATGWIETPVFVSAANIPDASGGDAGKGFTITGLAYDGTDDTFWAGNDGRNVEGDTTHQPSLVHLDKNGGVKMSEIDLGVLYPSAKSIQGVTVDTSDQTLWFVSQDEGVIRHITKSGVDLGYITADISLPNGLAYNPVNDTLFVADAGAGQLREYSCDNGVTLRSWSLGAMTGLDHLWYDAGANILWISYGASQTNGFLVSWDVATAVFGPALRLAGADAIEGIHMDGSNLWVANDAYFHNGNPALNRLLKYTFNHEGT